MCLACHTLLLCCLSPTLVCKRNTFYQTRDSNLWLSNQSRRYLGCSTNDTLPVKKKETKISPVKKTNPPPTSHPVITVTEANPSTPTGGRVVTCPVIDFVQLKRFLFDIFLKCNKQAHHFGSDNERVSAPTSPLSRSNTDSNIIYPYEDLPEASGASHFVNKDGGFDLHVILEVNDFAMATFHPQIDRHRHVADVCDIILLVWS